MRQRVTSRDIKAQQTRRRLMDAAETLLSQTEYAKVRVADIAKAAGVSVGTFYIYFPTKADIVVALLYEINGRLSAELPVNPQERIETQYRQYVDFYHRYILANGYMLSKALQTAIMLEGIEASDAGVSLQGEYLTRLIETGIQNGELHTNKVTAERFIHMFLYAVNGILFEWVSGPGDEQGLGDNMESLKLLIEVMR